MDDLPSIQPGTLVDHHLLTSHCQQKIQNDHLVKKTAPNANQSALERYLKPKLLVDKAINSEQPPSMQPPSDIILSVHKKYENIPPDNVVCATSEDVLLPVGETRMWFEHLHHVSLNRKKKVRKNLLPFDPRERQRTSIQYLMMQMRTSVHHVAN
jgi:hypothetical protein